MARRDVDRSLAVEVDSAKLELMRIRFRRILGESVSPHVVKKARKNVAKCVRLLENVEGKNV
ncbi:MAG: 50S ribosomal protein L29 [Holosporaceae bacterium]|jgi:ribosomal protein L29|nr:50S ribosomal protein L29 [Holosporaceae bacterium]